jgi:endonuclease-3
MKRVDDRKKRDYAKAYDLEEYLKKIPPPPEEHANELKMEETLKRMIEKQENSVKILNILKANYPDAKRTALKHDAPFQLLIATILSAQCTDAQVNIVSKKLFKKYKTPEDFASADLKELEAIIKPTGFFRNKSKFIKEASKKLVEDFNSRIPQSIEELTSLPGVARKTANVVLSNAFGVNQGIAVDTHVLRLSKRLGFTKEKNREKIEKDLMNLFPRERWFEVTNLLIAHGRAICKARKPRCDECVVNELCSSAFTFD